MIIDRFFGIAPRYKNDPAAGFALTAENVDLFSEKIRSVRSDKLVQPLNPDDIADHNDMTYHNGQFLTGKDKHYHRWITGASIDGEKTLDILIYLDDKGKLKKSVNGTVADLGCDLPAVPTVEDTGAPGGATYEEYSTHIKPNDPLYDWKPSGSNNEYYLAYHDGTIPNDFVEPNGVKIKGTEKVEGVVGSLNRNEWGWGNNDGLLDQDGNPANTVYVKVWTTRNYYGATIYYYNPDEALYGPGDSMWDHIDDSWIHIIQTGTVPVYQEGTNIIDDSVQYIITWSRDVNGHLDESGPSDPTEGLEIETSSVKITRPSTYPDFTTHWNIYRLGENTAEFLLVDIVPISQENYYDSKSPDDLGETPPSWYKSRGTENEIIFRPPPTRVDGIIGMHAGMLFYYLDSRIFWNEPEKIDAWNSDYWANAPAKIKGGKPIGGTVSIITANGPFRLDGTDPENMIPPTRDLGEEPCPGRAIAITEFGLTYLGDSGITNFDGVQTRVISDESFGEDWFVKNINYDTARMVDGDGILTVYHDGGQLVIDHRTQPFIVTTRDEVIKAAYFRPEDGKLFKLKVMRDGAGIYESEMGDDFLTGTWESGNLLNGSPVFKPWNNVVVNGDGDAEVTAYIDGVEAASKTMELSHTLDRKRRLMFPQHSFGRSSKVKLVGTLYVDEVIVE